MWSISLRNAVFAATLVGYLEGGILLTLPQVRDILGSAYPLSLIARSAGLMHG